MTDAVVALLRELVLEVRGLRADMATAGDARRLSADDRAWLSALLPEIARLGLGTLAVADLMQAADGRQDPVQADRTLS